MKQILFLLFDSPYKDILGFKGGTLAYFHYGLDRFSTDLDIDLLDIAKEQEVIDFINNNLPLLGESKRPLLGKELHRWKFNYARDSWIIKIELNKRQSIYTTYDTIIIDNHQIKAQTPTSMATNKLLALGDRWYNRDLFDIHFFLTKGYIFQENIIQDKMGQSVSVYIQYIIDEIPNRFQGNTILHQLGEVLNNKQKSRVKSHLVTETIKLLERYTNSIYS